MQLSDLPDLYGNELNMQHFTKLIRGSPRTRAIKDRLKWDKKNYDLIEEHDQFYRDHKLLLSLFRVSSIILFKDEKIVILVKGPCGYAGSKRHRKNQILMEESSDDLRVFFLCDNYDLGIFGGLGKIGYSYKQKQKI